mgnify:FL=1
MSDRSVKTAVQKLAGTFKEDTVQLIIGTVESVDDDKAICSVKIQNDVILPNVSLQASICDGLLIIPVVDSTVYVLTSKYNTPLVIQWSDIDKFMLQVGDSYLEVNNDGSFQFNDGSFDGLVKVGALVDKINALENLLNGFITIYNTHTHTASSFGAPTTVPSAIESQQINPITQQQDIENDKIKHGT